LVRFYAARCAIDPREQGERYDHGHLSRITLHPPMYGMNFGAAFAWQPDPPAATFVNKTY
jgi:hypothetical protein